MTSGKLSARLPRGFADRSASEIRATERMLGKIRRVYEAYGFEPVETPLVEYTDALGKFLPDQDRPNEGVFSFQDDDEQWLSLRYDLTAPLARFVAENFDRLPKPYRSYRAGWVFRNEKPGPGRFRQFLQFDADIVGAPSVAADAEICMMAADCLEELGIARGDYVIKVNSRKILDGILESVGLGGAENADRRLTVFRAIDKKDRLGIDGVRALLGRGRLDESGDFTKGANLEERQIEPLIRYMDFHNIYNMIQHDEYHEVETHFPNPYQQPPTTWEERGYSTEVINKGYELSGINVSGLARSYSLNFDLLGETSILFKLNDTLRGGLAEIEHILDALEASGFDADRVIFDPSVVRGLEYYTGPVYEAELTFPVKNEAGEVVRFGSVGGGGRYDGLVARFRGETVPATGFSIGVSRLAAALKGLGKLGDAAELGPVVVLVLDRERLADYQRLAADLRRDLNRDRAPGCPPIPVETYLGGAGLKAQMKYADRRNSPCVVIQGSDEVRDGTFQVKDLIEGKRLSGAIADNREWRESRPAQVTVPAENLVGTIRDILGRHGG